MPLQSHGLSIGWGHPLVVGTLAGDDTCLLIAKDARCARELAREIESC